MPVHHARRLYGDRGSGAGGSRGADCRSRGPYREARIRLQAPVASWRFAYVGQLHGAAPCDRGLRFAATAVDASYNRGWVGAYIDDRRVTNTVSNHGERL